MNKNVRLGLVLPLVGVTVAWLSMMIATYMDLGLNTYYSNAIRPEVRVSTYVVLAGFAIASGLVLWGFRLADGEHVSRGDVPLVRAVYRFGGLMVVLALVADVIFAFATFISSIEMSWLKPTTLEGRTLGVYLPILLDAILVVFVLLSATIWRKSSPVEGSGSGMSATQKALALGYAVPVIGAAIAIIIGLAVYDFQKKSIQNWTWVVIQLILGVAIVLGTRFAAKARLAIPVVRAPRVAGAAGAVRLNYVLSLVFAGVVSFMSFIFGAGAVNGLSSPSCDDNGNCDPNIFPVTTGWWTEQMVPAFLLLVIAQVATYVVIVSRNKEEATA